MSRRRTTASGPRAGNPQASAVGAGGGPAVRSGTAPDAALTSSGAALPLRIDAIDGLRGIALGMMIVYHFSFDLNWFGVIHADFNHDAFWLGFRDIIVTIFMSLVGISLALAARANIAPRRFWRRIGLIVACALLVTIGSYVTFPATYITFGILHCIAVSSLLAWPLVRYPRVALALGIVLVAVGNAVKLPLFDTSWLNWIGMMTHKPVTEDYVPLLPWLGVVLIGIALGWWLLGQLASRASGHYKPDADRTPAWLAWLGRHSLLVYMLHQPILIGLLRVLL